jgi:hypothetical protein
MYTNKKWHSEPEIKEGNMVYLSTKNLSIPKERASKLVPKYVRPYKVTKTIPSSSNYKLENRMILVPQMMPNGQWTN